MTQLTLDGYAEGIRRRDIGIERVSTCSLDREQYVKQARSFALHFAAKNGEVSSDVIQTYCPPPSNIGHNIMGAIFVGLRKELELIEYRPSNRPTRHAGRNGVYKLRGK